MLSATGLLGKVPIFPTVFSLGATIVLIVQHIPAYTSIYQHIKDLVTEAWRYGYPTMSFRPGGDARRGAVEGTGEIGPRNRLNIHVRTDVSRISP